MINIWVQTGRNLSDNNTPGLEEQREAAASQEEIRLNNAEKIEAQLAGEQQAETDGDHPGAALIITLARKMTTMLQCDFSPTVLYYLYFIILKWCSVIVYFYN